MRSGLSLHLIDFTRFIRKRKWLQTCVEKLRHNVRSVIPVFQEALFSKPIGVSHSGVLEKQAEVEYAMIITYLHSWHISFLETFGIFHWVNVLNSSVEEVEGPFPRSGLVINHKTKTCPAPSHLSWQRLGREQIEQGKSCLSSQFFGHKSFYLMLYNPISYTAKIAENPRGNNSFTCQSIQRPF